MNEKGCGWEMSCRGGILSRWWGWMWVLVKLSGLWKLKVGCFKEIVCGGVWGEDVEASAWEEFHLDETADIWCPETSSYFCGWQVWMAKRSSEWQQVHSRRILRPHRDLCQMHMHTLRKWHILSIGNVLFIMCCFCLLTVSTLCTLIITLPVFQPQDMKQVTLQFPHYANEVLWGWKQESDERTRKAKWNRQQTT